VTPGRGVRGGVRQALVATWLATACLTLACLAVAAPPAGAHAGLVTSDPAAGAALGASPSAIRLTFSEVPVARLSHVTVRSKRGVDYASGPAEPAPGAPAALVVPVRTLPRGLYTVDWRVDSSVDGHVTTGAYPFGVGVPPSALAGTHVTRTVTPVSSPLEIVARWLFLLGLLVLVGALSSALGGFDGQPRRSLAIGSGGWATAVLGLLVLAEAQRRNAGSSFGALFGSSVGHALIWRAAALAAAGAALLTAWRGRERGPRFRRLALAAAGAAVLAAIVVHVDNGHAAHAGSWPPALTVVFQAVHLTVAGIWLGGLAALLLGTRGEPSPAKSDAISRFSLIAGAGLATVVATGIVRAFSELRSWGELFSSGYGVAIVVKLALVSLIALLGWRARRRAVPVAGSDLGPLRRLASGELLLAGGAVVAAAVLGTLGPPVSVAYSGLVGLSASGSDSTKSVRVSLTTASNAPGANTFTVTADGYDSGDPLTGVSVSLRFTPLDDPEIKPSDLSLTPEARHPGTYTGIGSNLRFDGRWGVLVVVKRGRGAVGVPLELTIPTSPQQISVQRIPGQAPLYSRLDGNLGVVSISPHPQRAGTSAVHVGVYTPALGDEEPLAGIVVTLAANGGPVRQQPVTRTGAGTVISRMQLVAGRDQIAVVAHTRYGQRLRSVFDLTVPRG
jgi:copper transport protein